MNNAKKCLLPYVLWSVLFTAMPLLLICYFAVTNSTGTLTFQNIFKALKYWNVFLTSIILGFASTIICFFIAFPVSYTVSRFSKKWQNILTLVVMLPMWMNILLRTYSWMTILEYNGILNRILLLLHLPKIYIMNTWAAVVLGMVYNFIPYMILPLHASLSKIDKKIIESAKDLGANRRSVFLKILLPLSIPGIISGATIVFVPSVSTFVISNILGGGKNLLIGDLIEMQFLGSTYDPYFGSALSLVLMLLVLVFVGFINKFEPKNKM